MCGRYVVTRVEESGVPGDKKCDRGLELDVRTRRNR